MMGYNIPRSQFQMTASQDAMTIISNSVRSFIVFELEGNGAGTSSGYDEVGLYSVTTAGSTGGGAITPSPIDLKNSVAFGGVVDTTWSTQPVVNALMQLLGINVNGARAFWRAAPNLVNAITVPGGANAAGTISLRPVGTPVASTNISLRVQVFEL